jgi:hypothetical protein
LLSTGVLKAIPGGPSKTACLAAAKVPECQAEFPRFDWPKKLKMEQAESRKEKFVHALAQLQAISRQYRKIRRIWRADVFAELLPAQAMLLPFTLTAI